MSFVGFGIFVKYWFHDWVFHDSSVVTSFLLISNFRTLTLEIPKKCKITKRHLLFIDIMIKYICESKRFIHTFDFGLYSNESTNIFQVSATNILQIAFYSILEIYFSYKSTSITLQTMVCNMYVVF